ncbi:MAG: cell wall hydrolase [Devosia sp.]|uniref:cell wall hydrolase n=1 Tax=Devosia sp. TaxID=1871048 RepID=UPI001AC59927|nr:cell wall hydrolase [Devosia sp.]MBN9317391.1 cell wall hydrolase [Devosia sp.]
MAHYRTTPVHRARHELAVLKACAGFALAAFAIAGLTGAAHAPDLGSREAYEATLTKPTITRSGSDVIITGSIDNIFLSESFVGTNRALKQDRDRPEVALAEVTRSFEGIRAQIAALRNKDKPAGVAPVATAAAELSVTTTPPSMPVAVASIDPALTTPALDAIEGLAGSGVPTPLTMSDKLAYARADLPATVFDGPLMDKKGKKVSDKELWCMATAIYFEARGESYRGQVAVGQVVMNRVAHRLYPDTICGVVFQNQNKRNACQFSFACDGIPERVTEQKSWDQAMQIAKDVIAGKEYLTEVGYATHYHATYVYPHWAPRMKKVTKIGMHVFYQFKRGWKFG